MQDISVKCTHQRDRPALPCCAHSDSLPAALVELDPGSSGSRLTHRATFFQARASGSWRSQASAPGCTQEAMWDKTIPKRSKLPLASLETRCTTYFHTSATTCDSLVDLLALQAFLCAKPELEPELPPQNPAKSRPLRPPPNAQATATFVSVAALPSQKMAQHFIVGV